MSDNKIDRGELNDAAQQAVQVMREGGVILYPTDTVWGLGCDATNAEAIARIYRIKQRDDSKALIVMVDSMAKVASYVSEVPDIAWELLEAAVRPMTIIYPQARQLPDNLVAADRSIAIRVTDETVSQTICRMMRVPIISTSANISGAPTPQNFSEISEDIKAAVDYIVPLRQDETERPSPSNIIKLAVNGEFKILR